MLYVILAVVLIIVVLGAAGASLFVSPRARRDAHDGPAPSPAHDERT